MAKVRIHVPHLVIVRGRAFGPGNYEVEADVAQQFLQRGATEIEPLPIPANGSSFTQTFPSEMSTWTVNHNLGRQPLVFVLNTGGSEVEAEVIHHSINQVAVYFCLPTAGSITCI